MGETQITANNAQGETLDIGHAEFCRGLPAGHFRLIVNPQKARKYVRHRLFLIALTLPVVGLGAALALSGSPWIGLLMIVAGVALNRLITYQAPKILLYLATQDARTYREAIDFEIMEVRSAR